MAKPTTPAVHKVILGQLLAAGFIATGSLFLSARITAFSILLGGLISALPNGYFAFRAFRYQGASNADLVVRSFMRAEFGKLALTLVLFALCFSLLTDVNALALILGFAATHVVGLVIAGSIDYTPSRNGR